jgi:protein O-mannosyl-transferase
MKRRNRSKVGGNPSVAWQTVSALAIIAIAAVAAYHNSFSGPFVFDGVLQIEQNPNIRSLWPPWAPMLGTQRPIPVWSCAVNYALGRTNTWGYHVANLAIHLAAALALFGVVRRTLSSRRLVARFGSAAWGLALAVAVLWLVHPLQTESVTYIYQRCESLMGLFLLLTLYGFIRAQNSPTPNRWYVASVVCCLLAVTSKEVAAVAPLLVLWYDRALVASSWHEIVRRRWRYYAALAGTWPILAGFMLSQAHKFADAGVLVVKDVTPWQYAVSQPGVILYYLRLCFWPTGLCLYYGWPAAATFDAIVPPLLLIATLLTLTIWAIFRRPAWSFVGAWFFLTLAPTSSVLPIRDLAFEHRMYLPLAAVVTGVVIGGYLVGQWVADRQRISRPALQIAGGALLILAGVALGTLTFQRNADYQSNLSIWTDTVAKTRNKAPAHNGIALALAQQGQFLEAIAHYQKALEITPDDDTVHTNLGVALVERGRLDEGIAQYRKALEIRPNSAEACNNLGLALNMQGHLAEAVAQFEKALEIDPSNAKAHCNLGGALAKQGRRDAAIDHFEKALEITPDDAEVHNNVGAALVDLGQFDQAIAQYRNALEIQPEYAKAHSNLGVALLQTGRSDDAIAHCRKAVELAPSDANYLYNLGNALDSKGQGDEAVVHYRKALEINPDFADAHNNLGALLADRGRLDEAIVHYRKAIEINPQYGSAFFNLGNAFAGQARWDDAVAAYEGGLKIAPGRLEARVNLGLILYQRGSTAQAIAQWAEVIRSQPDNASALNHLAWALASSPEASVRDGRQAVELAERAAKLTGGNDPNILDTLAATYAEAGRFSDALQTAHTALKSATQQNNGTLAESIKAKMGLYEAGKPFREMTQPSANSSAPP